MGGYIRGQALTCALMAVFTWIVLIVTTILLAYQELESRFIVPRVYGTPSRCR